MSKKWEPDVLILGPGGIKGFYEIGALIILQKASILNKLSVVIGVSVGALIGLMYTAGYSPEEIINDAVETDLFQDVLSIRLIDIKENTGLLSNRPIKYLLEKRMKEKFGRIPTLDQLYNATGIDFICVGTNITDHTAVYFSRSTYPDLSCVDAVLISMNIPLLFHKIKYQGKIYIDGACSDPYPVHLYDDGKHNILGLYIDTVYDDPDASLFSYAHGCLHSQIIQNIKRAISVGSPMCRHLCLKSDVIDTTGISLDKRIKGKMVILGMNRASEFILSL